MCYTCSFAFLDNIPVAMFLSLLQGFPNLLKRKQRIYQDVMMVVVPNPNELKLIISIIIFEILSTLL